MARVAMVSFAAGESWLRPPAPHDALSSGSTTEWFWRFDGEIQSGGRMSGTHDLTDGPYSYPGTWTATRR